jgi:pyridoxamine 5'-phosphate oxidase-like protein
MGKVLHEIDDRLRGWLLAQHVFFVGTAPLDADGHLNISPKGFAGSFAVLGPREVAYLDHTGSGIETVAHLRENGRICVMFCAFDGPPKIVRLHGRGVSVTAGDSRFDELAAQFAAPLPRGLRSIVRMAVDRVSDSCGFGVPLMDYRAERETMDKWVAQKSDESLAAYRAEKNAASIDGLPGLPGVGRSR